jgi:CRISPR/Cas system-associated exonuclease Cas4 (RecB family)
MQIQQIKRGRLLMKRKISVFILVILFTVLSGCKAKQASKEALADAKAMLIEMTGLIERTSAVLKDVKDAQAAGQALMEYGAAVKKMMEKGTALQRKHPDFNATANNSAVKEAAENVKKALNVLARRFSVMEKKYGDKKAYKKGKAIMKELLKGKKK